MKIYIPYFNGGWRILAADAEKVRKSGRFIHYCGTSYGENAFTTEAAAYSWICKDYGTAAKYAVTI